MVLYTPRVCDDPNRLSLEHGCVGPKAAPVPEAHPPTLNKNGTALYGCGILCKAGGDKVDLFTAEKQRPAALGAIGSKVTVPNHHVQARVSVPLHKGATILQGGVPGEGAGVEPCVTSCDAHRAPPPGGVVGKVGAVRSHDASTDVERTSRLGEVAMKRAVLDGQLATVDQQLPTDHQVLQGEGRCCWSQSDERCTGRAGEDNSIIANDPDLTRAHRLKVNRWPVCTIQDLQAAAWGGLLQ